MPKKEKKMNIPSVKTETEATETQEAPTTETPEVEATATETQEAPSVETTDAPEVTNTPETDKAPEAEPHVSVEGAFTDADRVPSNWSILPTEDGIEAFNANTGNRFQGSIADFNAKLKG